MLGQTARGSCLHIAEQANLQRNPLIQNILREVAQFHHLAVLRDGDVIDEPRSMSDAVRATVLNGLPNRFFSIPLASVNGDVEILPLDVMKSGYHFFWGGGAPLPLRGHSPAPPPPPTQPRA